MTFKRGFQRPTTTLLFVVTGNRIRLLSSQLSLPFTYTHISSLVTPLFVLLLYCTGVRMNETYQAKLSGSPPRLPPTMTDERGDVRLLPNPHTHNPPFQSQHQHQQQPQPIPVQLPNIYINPPLPQPQLQPHLQPQVEQHERQHDLGRDQRPRAEGTDHRHYQLNGPVPTPGPTVRMVKIGPFRFTKPHPLLWISLALSLIALVLEVPKGSLPTLTGRHKVLRVGPVSVSHRS